jgi:hypothetical protein
MCILLLTRLQLPFGSLLSTLYTVEVALLLSNLSSRLSKKN